MLATFGCGLRRARTSASLPIGVWQRDTRRTGPAHATRVPFDARSVRDLMWEQPRTGNSSNPSSRLPRPRLRADEDARAMLDQSGPEPRFVGSPSLQACGAAHGRPVRSRPWLLWPPAPAVRAGARAGDHLASRRAPRRASSWAAHFPPAGCGARGRRLELPSVTSGRSRTGRVQSVSNVLEGFELRRLPAPLSCVA